MNLLAVLIVVLGCADALRVAPSAVRRAPAPRMGRYADDVDRRLSAGGSGGGIGTFGGARKKKSGRGGDLFGTSGVSGTQGFDQSESSRIRQAKLDAYINNDLEPADGTVPKIIAGAMLFSIFSGLAGVMMYYGGDGIMTQLAK